MAEEQLNLVQKLAKIRAISDVVSKEKRGYNYSYADITTILAKITAGMKKYGVSLIPQIVPGTSHVQQNVVTNTISHWIFPKCQRHTTTRKYGAEVY